MRYLIIICFWIVSVGLLPELVVSQEEASHRDTVGQNEEDPFIQVRPTSARETDVTLKLILADVLNHNPSLQAARARVIGADARVPQVRAWDDPLVGFEFYSTPITSINPLADGMETDYFVQQMIPFPGKKGLMADAAEASARAMEKAALAVERNLIAETKRTYAMLYSAQRRAEVNEHNQQILEQVIASARSKYGVGNGDQSDVLKVQVELARLQNERSALDQELASGAAMLNALRNTPTTALMGRLADIEPVQLSLPLDSLLRQSIDSRPEILGMKYELAMNRSELAGSKRDWFPDLMIKGTYKQMMGATDQWAAMIGINLPIAPWSIGKYSGKVEENEALLHSTEQSISDMQNMIMSEVRDAYAKVLSRAQQIERYKKTILPQTEQAFNATLASYRIDKVDFLSLLDSYRMLQMFRMEYYMALGDYLSSVATLERAIGTDLR